MVCDKTAESKLLPLLILEPEANSEAALDAYYNDRLCRASGQANGMQIAGIYAICEQLADEHAPITYDAGDAINRGVFVGYSSSWTGYLIPGAHVGWNALVVGVFYYGYPAPPTVTETRKFIGVPGNCSQSFFASSFGSGLVPQLKDEAAAVNATLGRLGDLIDMRWLTEVQDHSILREPVDRDGDWMLYRNLPVDLPLGCVLGLDGKPLRATAISVAAESIHIRRKLTFPYIDLRTPSGSGRIAGKLLPPWYFPGHPEFGVTIHQMGQLEVPPFDITQLITSTTRDAPTCVGVDPTRPLHVAVNSPRAQDWMNEGQIDLWVRVDAK